MFFQVYGANALSQWGMMFVVLIGLILLNEFARRTKFGGIFTFLVVPLALTVYFVAIAIGVRTGAEWALNNQTHLYMNGWFHYAKLYAATAGCIGFMMIKYKWGIGAKHWFKPFPGGHGLRHWSHFGCPPESRRQLWRLGQWSHDV